MTETEWRAYLRREIERLLEAAGEPGAAADAEISAHCRVKKKNTGKTPEKRTQRQTNARKAKRIRKSILIRFFVFFGDLEGERLNIRPALLRQPRQRKQEAAAEIILFAAHDIADEGHDLLVARDLHEHLALTGAQPALIHSVSAADGRNHNIGNRSSAVFHIVNHVSVCAERCAERGLRKPFRFPNFFNSAIRSITS